MNRNQRFPWPPTDGRDGRAPVGILRATSALALLTVALGSASVTDARPLPFDTKTVRLENGLTLVMIPFSSPGLIAYYTVVRAGSRDEVEKGVTGFAHFFEHMMFRGTDRYPPDKVDALLRKTGADQNGFTTDDFTCYTFFGSNAHVDELIDYEADRLQNLKYSEEIFRTESKAVLGEYNKSASNPMLKLEERLRELTFKSHTYGHTTLGYLADIEAMPEKYAYSRTFFERYYTADNTTLIVVGDFDPAKIEALVSKHYGVFSRKRSAMDVATEPPQAAEIRDHIAWHSPTNAHLSMSWRIPATDFASSVTSVSEIAYALFFGKLSPLYQELVLQNQLVLEFTDETWSHRDPYLFHVVAKVKDATKLSVVEATIQRAVEQVQKRGVPEKLLADVKSHVRYQVLLQLDTPVNVANAMAFMIGATGQPNALSALVSRIQKISSKDVQTFAKTFFTAKNRAVVTLTSEAAQ